MKIFISDLSPCALYSQNFSIKTGIIFACIIHGVRVLQEQGIKVAAVF